MSHPINALIVAVVAITVCAAPSPARAQKVDCAAEAVRLERAEAELPKLDIAPPGDRQIVCITLETNVLFARRLAAHLQQCPRSPYARSAERWTRLAGTYNSQFRERGCKTAIKNYRG